MVPATHAAITVAWFEKRIEDVQAVTGLNFEVCLGGFIGFLCPNRAGKTTTTNMLTGLARAGAGTIRIGGIDCSASPGRPLSSSTSYWTNAISAWS